LFTVSHVGTASIQVHTANYVCPNPLVNQQLVGLYFSQKVLISPTMWQ